MRKVNSTSFLMLVALWIVAAIVQAKPSPWVMSQSAMASSIVTDIDDGSEVYIRYNAGSDAKPEYRYWNAGAEWGTCVVTAHHAVAFKLIANGNVSTAGDLAGCAPFAIEGFIANGNGTNENEKYLGSGTYGLALDKSKTSFYFVPAEGTNKYYIYWDTKKQYVTPGSLNGRVSFSSSKTIAWEVISKEQFYEDISHAAKNDSIDVTWLVSDPNFGRNVKKTIKANWIIKGGTTDISLTLATKHKVGNTVVDNNGTGNANDGKYFLMKAIVPADGSAYSVQQTITGLPAGKYRVCVTGFTDVENACELFADAGEEEGEFGSVAFGQDANCAGYQYASACKNLETNAAKYRRYVDVDVVNGSLIIGCRGKEKTTSTAFWDNVELYYRGPIDYTISRNYTPSAMKVNDKWIEVTSSDDDALQNPENYLFTIWRNSGGCYSVGSGAAGGQGEDFKAMKYKALGDPNADLSCVWEFYKTSDGKYVLVNAAERQYFLQTDDDNDFAFRFNDDTSLDVSKGSVTLEPKDNNNWFIKVGDKYMYLLSSTDFCLGNVGECCKIYAMPRPYYVMERDELVYNTTVLNPADVSLMIQNTEGLGTYGSTNGIKRKPELGWLLRETSNAAGLWTMKGSSSDFPLISGNGYFSVAPAGTSSSTIMYQTVKGLVKGNYKLTASCSISSYDGVSIEIGPEGNATRYDLSDICDNGRISVDFKVMENQADYTISIKTEREDKEPFNIDDFKLTYFGASSEMSLDFAEGYEYYIRRNVSNTAVPEYQYVNAGYNWQTQAILSEHPFPFVLSKNGESSTLEGFEGLQPYSLQSYLLSSGKYGYLSYSTSAATTADYINFYCDQTITPFIFKPVDLVNKPSSFYVYGTARNTYLGVGALSGGYLPVVNSELMTEWEIVPKSRLISEMSAASPHNPIDATFFIQDPAFNRYNGKKSSWILKSDTKQDVLVGAKPIDLGNVLVNNNGSSHYSHVVGVFDKTNTTSPFYIQQSITGLPDGYYRLSAYGFSKCADACSLFANDDTGELASVPFEQKETGWAKWSSQYENARKLLDGTDKEWYKKTIEFQVTNGSVTIGVKGGTVENDTTYFDNMELYYIGTEPSGKLYYDVPLVYYPNKYDNSWVEVKSLDDDALVNPQNYFFTIWEDSESCVALGSGTDGYQGAGNKTMTYKSGADPMNDVTCLWEVDTIKNDKFVFVSIADREVMMQTDGAPNYFRYNDNVPLDVDNASVTLEMAAKNNWAILTQQGYLHRWSADCNDMVVDGNISYHKIYAIPRSYYVMNYKGVIYRATKYTSEDVSLLLANPEAVGTSGTYASGIPAWKTRENVWTKEGDVSDFAGISGKNYFEYKNTIKPRTNMSQTISHLPKGKYVLSVSTENAPQGVYLYAEGTGNDALRVPLSDAKNNVVSLTVSVDENDGSIEYGVEFANCVANDDGYYEYKFDNFRLSYLGTPDKIDVPLIAGEEYYIRYNFGTSDDPEYRYLESGGTKWGTAAVLSDHGFAYKLKDAGVATKGDYVGLQQYYIYSSVGDNSAKRNVGYKDKYYQNDCDPKPWILIPNTDNSPFEYSMYYADRKEFIKFNENASVLYSNLMAGTSDNHFEFVPRVQRLKEMEQAAAGNPVDATFLINDPDFSRDDSRQRYWKLGTAIGDTLIKNTEVTVNNVAIQKSGFVGQEKENSTCNFNIRATIADVQGASFDIFQKIKNVPNGHYKVSASGVSTAEDGLIFYVSNGTDTGENVFPQNAEITKNTLASELFRNDADGDYKCTIEIDVTDSILVIGFKGSVQKSNNFFDNVELYFYGDNIIGNKLEPVAYKPSSMKEPWIEVSSVGCDAMKNPEKYLFAIWADKTNCLALTEGSDNYQGSDYKTMSYVVTDNPINNINQLWELYHLQSGDYVIVNASDRENMMQSNAEYCRYNKDTQHNISNAAFTIYPSEKYNWQIYNANNYYIGRWDNEVGDVKLRIADGDYFKLYAIPRIEYYKQTQNLIYNASVLTNIDVSLLLANPEGFGDIGGNQMLGWDLNTTNEMAISDTTEHKFSALKGKTYFEYRGSSKPNTVMNQTITDLPRGYYLFSVATTCAGSGAKIYAQADGTNAKVYMSEELSSADAATNIVYVPVELAKDGGEITFGVDLSKYTHKRNEEDIEENSSAAYVVKFDHFTLQYMGVTETLASELSNGTYYIRTNLNEGTDKTPEYRYLDAGGNAWGTDPILGNHGMSFLFERKTDYTESGIFYSLKSEENQESSGHGPYFDGAHYDHEYSYSVFSFKQIDPQNPLKYSIYAHNAIFSDPDKVYKKASKTGYLTPMSNNFDLDVDPDASGNAVVWEIVNTTQRIKELQDATYDNPMDATFFIKDPSFSRNNVYKTSWRYNSDDNVIPVTLGNNESNNNEQSLDGGATKVSIGKEADGSSGNRYDFNVKVTGQKNIKSDYNLYQKVAIDNLPAGLYRLSVHGYSNVDGGAVLYAKDENGDLNSLNLGTSVSSYQNAKEQNYAAYLFTGNEDMRPTGFTEDDSKAYYRQDMYCQSIDIKVTSNTLIVGVRGALSANEYAVFDNFELYYLGEAAQDITDITEPVERYFYNVDAGMYLTKGVDTPILSFLGTEGTKYCIAPVSDTTDKFTIYTTDVNNKKLYLAPYRNGDAVSYVTANSSSPYKWTIKPVSAGNDHIYEITDSIGRVLEWTGDAGKVVYAGFANDPEPRGTRWSIYEPGQYQKDRMFATLGSSVRNDAWRIVRAVRVNMKTLQGAYEIANLANVYGKLDAVWVSPMASASFINQKLDDLKRLMTNAMDTCGSTNHPIDVSFFIQNAGLGDGTGWKNYGNWLVTKNQNKSTGSNASKFIPSVERFLYQNSNNKPSLSQIINDVPAGRYKLAVDLRTRGENVPADFELALINANNDTISERVSGYSNTINETFTTNYIDLETSQNLTISIHQIGGSIAFDNFRLYYCGNINGKMKLNDDATELTLLGDWEDDDKDWLYDKAKNVIKGNENTLGVVYAYKSDVTLPNEQIDVTKLGWQSDNNVLFYTDYDRMVGDANVVRKQSESSYSCNNMVITDKMPLYVPQQFTASSVLYCRDNVITLGSLCLPFDLKTIPTGITNFLVPDEIDWDANPTYGKMLVKNYESDKEGVVLPSNTPVLYNGVAGSTISISESDVLIHRTNELKKPDPVNDGLTLYGNYTKTYIVGTKDATSDEEDLPNGDGLRAQDCYYVQSSSKIVRGFGWFKVGSFRAFLYKGKNEDNNARVSVLYIDYTDIADGIKILEGQDSTIIGYYDVRGVRYDKPQKGLNIVKYLNGASRKVYVR